MRRERSSSGPQSKLPLALKERKKRKHTYTHTHTQNWWYFCDFLLLAHTAANLENDVTLIWSFAVRLTWTFDEERPVSGHVILGGMVCTPPSCCPLYYKVNICSSSNLL